MPDQPAMIAAARLVRGDDAFDLGHVEPARPRERRRGRERLRLRRERRDVTAVRDTAVAVDDAGEE